MPSALYFGLFLATISTAAGRSLPLIDGDKLETMRNSTAVTVWNSVEETMWNSTEKISWKSIEEAMRNSTEDTLSNSPEWDVIPSATELSLAENDTAQRWTQTFVQIIFNCIAENIEGPYYEAYSSFDFSENNCDLYKFDADTKALLNKTNITDLVLKMTQGKVHDAMEQEVDIIGEALEDIVSDLPNWLDTEALVKVDLGEVNLNPKAVLDAIFSNTKVSDQQATKLQEMLTRIKSLTARAERMGTDAAIYYAKLYNYIKEALPVAAVQVLHDAFGNDSTNTLWNSTGEKMWNSSKEAMWNLPEDTLWNLTEEALRNNTEGTLWNRQEWEELPNASELVSAENDTAQRWTQVFVLVIFNNIAENIEGPYYEAYSSFDFSGNNSNLYKFDADTKALLNKTYLPDLVLKMAEGKVHDVMDQEIDVIGQIFEDIVSVMPNWLDTGSLQKVDLSQIELTANVFLDTIFSNTKVPEQQAKMIQELMTSIKSLSARALGMGTDAAIYNAKLYNYLEEAAPTAAAQLLPDASVSD